MAILLDLQTPRERRKIRVDGKDYELRNHGEFTFAEQLRIAAEKEHLDKLKEFTAISQDDANALSLALTRVLCAVVIGGEAIADKLSDPQKLQVMTAFLGEAGAKPARKARRKR